MSLTLAIAPARSADTQLIAEMSRRLVEVGLPWTWTPARVARHLHHPDSLVVTARTNGAGTNALAGVAIMHFGDEIAHLNLLAVDSQFQRRGLGRQLLSWLEESAMTAGTFTVCLEVRARNPVALLFYRRLGFTESGRVPRYYSGREDALRMTKTLRHPLAPLLEIGDSSGSPVDDNERGADESGRYSVDWLTTRFKR